MSSGSPARLSARDVAPAVLGAGLAVLEVSFREDLPLPTLQLGVALALAATLVVRRTHPFAALSVAFAFANGMTLVGWLRALPELGLHASVLVLLHVYSVARRAAPREAALGLAIVLTTFGLSAAAGEIRGVEEWIGSLSVLGLPAAIGVSIRYRDRAHHTDLERAKLRERQMLARELHDTIGHHVSAIVVQAQAARAVFEKKPEKALAALSAIEGEATRSLGELRALVGALRDDAAVDLAPIGGAEAIAALVRDAGERVSLEREGDLDRLAPSVDLALHRIAREALHNATRHAREATKIEVRLAGEGSSVRLRVRDDGKPAGPRREGGFGLVGMEERATLLGGTFHAGPRPSGGFEVEVVLPRAGARA